MRFLCLAAFVNAFYPKNFTRLNSLQFLSFALFIFFVFLSFANFIALVEGTYYHSRVSLSSFQSSHWLLFLMPFVFLSIVGRRHCSIGSPSLLRHCFHRRCRCSSFSPYTLHQQLGSPTRLVFKFLNLLFLHFFDFVLCIIIYCVF